MATANAARHVRMSQISMKSPIPGASTLAALAAYPNPNAIKELCRTPTFRRQAHPVIIQPFVGIAAGSMATIIPNGSLAKKLPRLGHDQLLENPPRYGSQTDKRERIGSGNTSMANINHDKDNSLAFSIKWNP